MKKVIILYLILCFSLKIYGQIAPDFPIYNTALTLADSIKAYNKIADPSREQQLKMYKILGQYLLETKQLIDIKSTTDIQRAFIGNTFIKKSFRDENFWEFGEPISMSSREIGMESMGNSSVLSKVGNFNATIYADAFAKIIVKRFKQDMNALFFNKMKTEMDKSIELKTLFPNTYDGLRLINEDIYVFNQYIEGLRQKMEEDLANIFANTTALLETDKYAKMFKGNQSARDFLTTVSQLTDGLIRNEHPGHIIEKIHFSDAFDEGEGRDLKAGLQIVQLISAAFRSTTADSTHYWVRGMDSLNLLFKGDGLGAHIWLGTLYQLAADENGIPITFQDGKTMRQYINLLYDKKDDFYNMRNYVQGLMRRVNTIEMSMKDMKKMDGKEEKLYWDKMVSSYENILSLVKFAPTIKEILEPNAALPRTWYRGIYVAESLSRVYAEMRGREYHAAIQHIADIIQAINSRPKFIKKGDKYMSIDSIKNFYTQNSLKKWIPVREYRAFSGTYFMDNQTPFLIDKVYVDDDSLGKRPFENYTLKKFIKYSSFAASLVLAKTSDEVADLLESTMTSSGGTHVKESGWLLAVNSYIGLQKTYGQKDSAGYFSISAPIGLNLSYGFKRKPRYALTDMQSFGGFIAPHTIQLFASIIDVGAIAGFRFTNSTDSIPKVKLSNIFSPGLFLQFGRIFNSPLNIGVGYQAQPRLYAIKEESILLKKFQYRFSVNLSWDIPFWHLKYWGTN